MNSGRWRRWIVGLVALHSMGLGVAMLLCPQGMLRLAGWSYAGPSFFPAQSGLFLLILGIAYLTGIWYRPFVWLLLGSKTAAVGFLAVAYLLGAAPLAVIPIAALDGLMGAAVAGALLLPDAADGA